MTSELTTLFPGKKVTLNSGEEIDVLPFKFGQLPAALKLTQKIGGLIAQMVQSGELQDKSKTAASVVYILSEGGEDLFNLLGLCIGKDRAWFDTIQSDEGINLIIAFLEVNIDFFTQKMMPQLLEAMSAMKLGKLA